MIIYNVTIKVETTIAEDWMIWLKQEHIPEVMDSGCFSSYRILKLLDLDDEGVTHTIQYEAENMENYERYIKDFAAPLRDKSFEKWGNRFIAFRSLMQIVK